MGILMYLKFWNEMNEEKWCDQIIVTHFLRSRIFCSIKIESLNHFRQSTNACSLVVLTTECRDICILSKLYRFVSMWAVAEIKTIVHVCKHEHKNARCASIQRWFLFQFSFPRRMNSFTTKWFSSWKTRCNAFCIRLCTERSSWTGDLPLSRFNFFPSWTF